ncbi:MAG: hypothetical protein Tsb0017_21040 [Geothermobacteraceae bacterium]
MARHRRPPYIRQRIRARMARRTEQVMLGIFALVALLHLIRLMTGAKIVIAGTVMPLWTSWIGFAGPLLLIVLFLWSHAGRTR